MKARLARLVGQLHESYWFVPTIMALGAMLLAAGMVWLDAHQATTWMESLPWLKAARPDGARSLLSSIGGSMIGVAGTTFSVTIAAVVYASGQYGPRLLSNFMSDRGNQVTLGTFIATFLYSLIVVRTIRSPGEVAGEAAFVPQLALLVGVILVLCSIAVLIFFIHHVPSRIHINSVIERIGDRLMAEIDDRFPVAVGQPLDNEADDSRVPPVFTLKADAAVVAQLGLVRAEHTGYIQLIDESALLATAQQYDLVLRLQFQPGDFAHKGSALLEAYPAASLDDDATAALRGAFAMGSRRTALQDLRFLIDELVEIAARALSPGVNDPFTANSCVDWLSAALADLANRDMPSRLRADDDGAPRVIFHPITFADFVERSFGALAQYASADRIAALRFLDAISDVTLACQSPPRVEILASQVRHFRDLVEEALPDAMRAPVSARSELLLSALTDPDHLRRLREDKAKLGEII